MIQKIAEAATLDKTPTRALKQNWVAVDMSAKLYQGTDMKRGECTINAIEGPSREGSLDQMIRLRDEEEE